MKIPVKISLTQLGIHIFFVCVVSVILSVTAGIVAYSAWTFLPCETLHIVSNRIK